MHFELAIDIHEVAVVSLISFPLAFNRNNVDSVRQTHRSVTIFDCQIHAGLKQYTEKERICIISNNREICGRCHSWFYFCWLWFYELTFVTYWDGIVTVWSNCTPNQCQLSRLAKFLSRSSRSQIQVGITSSFEIHWAKMSTIEVTPAFVPATSIPNAAAIFAIKTTAVNVLASNY